MFFVGRIEVVFSLFMICYYSFRIVFHFLYLCLCKNDEVEIVVVVLILILF